MMLNPGEDEVAALDRVEMDSASAPGKPRVGLEDRIPA